MFRMVLFLSMFAVVAVADGRWYEYERCRLVHGDANDGDSFHVRTKSREFIIRLYFVDTPEIDMSIPDRVREQAEYWGIDDKEVLKIGKVASEFTKDLLRGQFKVYSKLEDARGRSKMRRFYGMVEKEGKSLATALVENGLARVYGMNTDLPDGKKGNKYIADLRVLERKAKREKLGAWGFGAKNSIFTLPEIEEQDVKLTTSLPVYSLDLPPRFLATAPKGTVVRVKGAQTHFNLRIVYKDADGVEQQCQCARLALGL